MKNLLPILVVILIVGGIIFLFNSSGGSDDTTLNTTTDQETDQSTNKDKGEINMNSKQYSSFPGKLAESERVGKKARFETNLGNFTVTLFGNKAPNTVSNFIFLAKEGFYNELTFHRAIADFMIQGGDPLGNGTGGPGYSFEDEFDSSLTFSKPGILAMANSGPNTNGSQFFITVAPTPHLNSLHTIFGEVVEGNDIVEKISKVQVDSSDRPSQPVVIKRIEII